METNVAEEVCMNAGLTVFGPTDEQECIETLLEIAHCLNRTALPKRMSSYCIGSSNKRRYEEIDKIKSKFSEMIQFSNFFICKDSDEIIIYKFVKKDVWYIETWKITEEALEDWL